jgi:hypothetical protein
MSRCVSIPSPFFRLFADPPLHFRTSSRSEKIATSPPSFSRTSRSTSSSSPASPRLRPSPPTTSRFSCRSVVAGSTRPSTTSLSFSSSTVSVVSSASRCASSFSSVRPCSLPLSVLLSKLTPSPPYRPHLDAHRTGHGVLHRLRASSSLPASFLEPSLIFFSHSPQLIYLVAHDGKPIPTFALIMLGVIYGCQVVIYVLHRKFEHIGSSFFLLFLLGIR